MNIVSVIFGQRLQKHLRKLIRWMLGNYKTEAILLSRNEVGTGGVCLSSVITFRWDEIRLEAEK